LKVFRKLDFISVFRCNLLSWAQYIELVHGEVCDKMRFALKVWSGKLKKSFQLRDVGTDGRIFKWRLWPRFAWLRIRCGGGFLWNSHEISVSTTNKLLLYKTILKPIWTYGIQLWGTASTSRTEILERFQSKVLRMIVDAPWYVPNSLFRKDSSCPTAKVEIRRYSSHYGDRLRTYSSTSHPFQSSRSKPSSAAWQQTPSPVSAYWSDWQILKLLACKSCSLLTHEALNLFIWRCATEHSSSCL
jgi:hypothetical protein